MFTNREIATALLVSLILGLFVVLPSLRRTFVPDVVDLLRALVHWKLLILFASYAAYLVLIVGCARALGAWNLAQLKDTVLIALFYGFPLLMSDDVGDGSKFVRSAVTKLTGLSAMAAFYVGLESFPLPVELILQVAAAFAGLMAAGAAHLDGGSDIEIRRFFNGSLVVLGASLIAFTTWRAITVWDEDRLIQSVGGFALSVWLGVALIPFVYVSAFRRIVGRILAVLPILNGRTKPPIGVRLAVITGLRGRTSLAASFTGDWRWRVARATDASDARRCMKEFRHHAAAGFPGEASL